MNTKQGLHYVCDMILTLVTMAMWGFIFAFLAMGEARTVATRDAIFNIFR